MEAVNKLIAADRQAKKRVLIIGDALLDEYVHGHLGSCQEDCTKFVEELRIVAPGGAANAARQLANWNAEAWLVAITGFRPLAGVYPSREYVDELCFREGEVPIKERFLVGDKHVFRRDYEHFGYRLTESQLVECRRLSLKAVQQMEYSALLISDYDKGFMDQGLIETAIGICNERGIPVVADAKREPWYYEHAVLKCNSQYLRAHMDIGDWPIKVLVVTHGEQAPIVGRKVLRHRPPVQCINHIGAGDCFSAHLALGLAHGLSLEEAAEAANSAGRVYVQHRHGRPPFPHEIRRDADPVGGKILDGNRKLGDLRKSIPGKMVFTNGVFRIPHSGHAWLMSWAREQGDCLVVGINDDKSAARARGGEFVLPLQERAMALASMSAVDWVVPFEADTPEAIMAFLNADMLVKGHELDGCRVPGDTLVKETRFAPPGPFSDRHATSLVAEIRS